MDEELHQWCTQSMDYRLIHGWVYPWFGCIIYTYNALVEIESGLIFFPTVVQILPKTKLEQYHAKGRKYRSDAYTFGVAAGVIQDATRDLAANPGLFMSIVLSTGSSGRAVSSPTICGREKLTAEADLFAWNETMLLLFKPL